MKLHLAKELTQVTATNYLMKMIRFLAEAPLQILAVLHTAIKQSVPGFYSSG